MIYCNMCCVACINNLVDMKSSIGEIGITDHYLQQGINGASGLSV